MWNLEKWYIKLLQNRNRGTDAENKRGHQGGKVGWEELGD